MRKQLGLELEPASVPGTRFGILDGRMRAPRLGGLACPDRKRYDRAWAPETTNPRTDRARAPEAWPMAPEPFLGIACSHGRALPKVREAGISSTNKQRTAHPYQAFCLRVLQPHQ